MTRILLCTGAKNNTPRTANYSCGQCVSCKLPAINEYPDYFEIMPTDDSKTIKIEQIRELIESLHQTSHHLGNRVIIIYPAESMNHSAANALLKTLEEPGAGCYFILISHTPAQLAATIRSRCQTLKIGPDFSEQTIVWVSQQIKQDISIATDLLAQAEGIPQRAVELAETNLQQEYIQLNDELSSLLDDASRVIPIAQRWQQRGLLNVIDDVIIILNQSIRGKIGISTPAVIKSKKFSQLATNSLINYTQYMIQVKRDLVMNPNLNSQLLGESVLLAWVYSHCH